MVFENILANNGKKQESEISSEVKETRNEILRNFDTTFYDLKKNLVEKGKMSQEEATKLLKEKFDYANTRFIQGISSESLN